MGVAQLYFMPHPLLEIVQRLMAHPVFYLFMLKFAYILHLYYNFFLFSSYVYKFEIIQKFSVKIKIFLHLLNCMNCMNQEK